MNLLITGGAGFIGSHLVRRVLEEKSVHRVINLDALTYAGSLQRIADLQSNPRHSFVHADLRDKAAVIQVVREHQVTHVMHLAAESHVDRSISGPDLFIHSNTVGTFNLLDACRQFWETHHGDHRFLHVSTDEVFGSLPRGFASETAPYRPSSPYSASKAAADLIVQSYQVTFGLPAMISYSSNNYGPHQVPEKLVPIIIRAVLSRQPVPLYGDGYHRRDWLYVADHVEALWMLLRNGRVGERYNIAAGQELTNRQIAEKICDQIDHLYPELGGNSRALITLVADRPGHDRRYALDTQRIREEIGWRPSTPLAEGLKKTITWYAG